MIGWWHGAGAAEPARESPSEEPAIDGAVQRSVLLGRLQDLLAWGRKNSLWPFNFGLSCCFVEMATSLTGKYDIARFGAEVLRGSPREADVMVIAGTPFLKMAPVIRRLYEQMMEPRWVISMGSCANSGGMYDIYSVVQGVDSLVPVDVYVPGCPPRPDAFMEGLLLLREAVGSERRPLGRRIGAQDVRRPERPVMREVKREARQRLVVLASPDRLPSRGSDRDAGTTPTSEKEHEGSRFEVASDSSPAGPTADDELLRDLQSRCPGLEPVRPASRDEIPGYWVPRDRVRDVLRYLKQEASQPFRMLYDLTAVDERTRSSRDGPPGSDFTVVYHLVSFDRNADVRLKVGAGGERPSVDTITDLWPAADWYEREVWDMFGVGFEGHPNLRRILMPPTWRGHPLRKDHPARATEMGRFQLSPERQAMEEEAERFRPQDWGLAPRGDDDELLFLNIGPHHPGAHGVLRVVLRLDGEEIVDAVPDIGFHHRGAEKMGERQSWHTYIPYTDRVEYLGGVLNNLPYLHAVEKLGGIDVPDRARWIRILLCELFRLSSHLVWYGTFAQDVGAMSPVFYMFYDRERVLEVVEAICGARMHPNWFRIGGVAQDLPTGWDDLVRDLLSYLPRRLREYDKMVMGNRIFKARTQGVGAYDLEQAIEWGVTGPGLRACGLPWDLRKKRPYGGYEQLEFDVPTAEAGDCYARAEVRVEEMRQSLRIIRQCLEQMPGGAYKSTHPLATPPPRDRSLHDIETLIHHFLSVSWGPVIPGGEAFAAVEGTKGSNGYYLTSDDDVHPYRVRIRTPSFPHLQMLREIGRGLMVPDLMALLGSIDYVLSDVDR